ncbi:phospholipase A I-like isoform X2 [Andrographis paniculata]|uniref:phospholipase A I-like isoform X2 n=1 Tax=Andrographis paniculata TaxID=175694 RepID=UPI0021E95D0F|nr:phospholipase A I-like isoform X2 [Andrographis paniculata]
MSWGLSWKRSESFHLTLSYGSDADEISQTASFFDAAAFHDAEIVDETNEDKQLGFRIDLDWNTGGDDEDEAAFWLQSQAADAFPPPEDAVEVELNPAEGNLENSVAVVMRVLTRREPLKGVTLSRAGGLGQHNDAGIGVLLRLMRMDLTTKITDDVTAAMADCLAEHWHNVSLLCLAGLGLTALPVEITQLCNLERLFLDNNKLLVLPPEIGSLKNLKVLVVDNNLLTSVPVELRECTNLIALSLEYNKLVRPLLDFRAMSELRVLRLFGNPLEFLPDIMPLRDLHHLSLPNIRIVASDNLGSVDVQIEMENSSYFIASRHKLSSLCSLIFRFSSCHHPLLASALAKMMQDECNRVVVGKDETALRQLISMLSSDDQNVVEQACSALSALASDFPVAMQLIKLDIMQHIERVLKSAGPEKVIFVLQIVVKLAFASDTVAHKMFTKDLLESLKLLSADQCPEVQKLALFAIGNLAFCLENRHALVKSDSLRQLLLRHTRSSDSCVCKAAARVLAILGENELLCHAVRGQKIPEQGLRILAMDGGGMKGLATVKMLKEIEKGTGRQIHELFDLICGTSTGGMLAAALGIKIMSLEKCEEIYKELGKLVFADPISKDNEVGTWREKLDQLYKSSSQSFRVAVHGSKHSAGEFERLLKEMCADEDGDLLIESAVNRIPKVFIVSTLVSVSPAQPFVFRNYQYPAGTPEAPSAVSENMVTEGGSAVTPTGAQVGYKCSTFMGSCKHQLWQAIRASSAAPYYLDDFSDGVYRWQDGAIVANNPTIFALREAQLLWPDAKVDCLVSIGCGSTPPKIRKGGWRYLDTGQVLIESACSVERAEEALNTLLAMLPDIQYFRFNPVDERCDMELDETDPAVWLQLENATDEYIENNLTVFRTLTEKLLEGRDEETLSVGSKSMPCSEAEVSNPSLGRRRTILLVEASSSLDSENAYHHAPALQTFCAENAISLFHLNVASTAIKSASSSNALPLFTGSFTSTTPPRSPTVIPKQLRRFDSDPTESFNGFQLGQTSSSPPKYPSHRSLPLPALTLHEKINSSPQVGILHLALQNDAQGAVLSWRSDVFVVAEPGNSAEKFVRSVKLSLLSSLNGGKRRKYAAASAIDKISTVAELISREPKFQVGSVFHRYIGRQTHVMEDHREISAYMFRRAIPSQHLIPEDVYSMVGDWRERIVIFGGVVGPTWNLTKALLDAGAKAVVCPSSIPEEIQSTLRDKPNGHISFNEGGGEDNHVVEAATNPTSDFENEPETSGQQSTCFWDDREKEVSEFMIKVYDSLYHGGERVDVAVKRAIESHPGMRYSCHLPQ